MRKTWLAGQRGGSVTGESRTGFHGLSELAGYRQGEKREDGKCPGKAGGGPLMLCDSRQIIGFIVANRETADFDLGGRNFQHADA